MQMPNEAKKVISTEEMGRRSLLRMSKSKLNGDLAAGFYYGTTVEEQYLFLWGESIKVFPVRYLKKSSQDKVASKYAVAFDMKKIKLNSVVELKVPKGQMGLFAGRHHWQVKEWCKQLGLKYIKIVEEA